MDEQQAVTRLGYHIDRDFPTARARLNGSLDSRGAPLLRAGLLDCLADQPVAVLVDIAELTDLEDAGAHGFVDVGRHNAQWPGACLVLFPVTSAVAHQLRRTGVGRYAHLCGSHAAAAAVAAAQPLQPRVRYRLDPTSAAPAFARTVVADACRTWGRPNAVSTAQVVASELVSNAVVPAGQSVDLTVVLRETRIDLAVRDGNPRPPRRWGPRQRGQLGEADRWGRGLLLLDAFAQSWGSLPCGGGKVVWATVPA